MNTKFVNKKFWTQLTAIFMIAMLVLGTMPTAQAQAAPQHDSDAETRLFALLEQGLPHLAADERELVERKYFTGQTVREIAGELKLSEKAVESRLVRVRLKLKQKLLSELQHEKAS